MYFVFSKPSKPRSVKVAIPFTDVTVVVPLSVPSAPDFIETVTGTLEVSCTP